MHRARASLTLAILVVTSTLAFASAALAVSPPPSTLRQLSGTWTELPPPPAGTNRTDDAVRMADGRIAVLRWGGSGEPEEPCAVTYSPADELWSGVTFGVSWSGCFGSQEQFALGTDGLLYSPVRTLDPTADPWQSSDSLIRTTWDANAQIGRDAAGNLYLLDVHGTPDGTMTILYRYDPVDGSVTEVSSVAGEYDAFVGGSEAPVYLIGANVGGDGIVAYRPHTDEWRLAAGSIPYVQWPRADIGPDGRVYVMGSSEASFHDAYMFAWDPSLNEWLTVPPPPELAARSGSPSTFDPTWSPSFVDGGDGRLYAMDTGRSFAFAPGEVVDAPAMGGGGSIPDTAMGTPPSPIEPFTQLALLLLVVAPSLWIFGSRLPIRR